MTTVTVKHVDVDQADDELPPPGTAIVRPMRHVRAVREQHLLRFANPDEAAASRAARAWSWVLGEHPVAPVTDRHTAMPPSRADVETEIAAANERRLRSDREDRADAAATILRWLIGDDDHVPVRCEKPGELVGGFGHIVRSHEEIVRTVAAMAIDGYQEAAAVGHNARADIEDRRLARQLANYLNGVAATLRWIASDQREAPISRRPSPQPTTRDVKAERVLAEDLIDLGDSPWTADHVPSAAYGAGVRSTIDWLLGDRITSPID